MAGSRFTKADKRNISDWAPYVKELIKLGTYKENKYVSTVDGICETILKYDNYENISKKQGIPVLIFIDQNIDALRELSKEKPQTYFEGREVINLDVG